MLEHFKGLTEDEKSKLMDAVPLITILVAGADGNIDAEELNWAEKVTDIRSYNLKGELKEFYIEVHATLRARVDHFLSVLPGDVPSRTSQIEEELANLNPILAKLNPAVGTKMYKGYISFAEHVAKASGGLLGFFSINPEEAKVITLHTLTPIDSDEEE